MTDDNRHPARIWATVNGSRVPMGSASTILIGGWESRQHRKAAAYVRADVADEALAALKAMPCYGCSVSPGDTSPTAIQQARGCVTCKRSRAAIAKLEGGGV